MGLSVEVRPIPKGAGHHHDMNVFERVAEVPWFLEVVDLELDVWGLLILLLLCCSVSRLWTFFAHDAAKSLAASNGDGV